MQETKFTATLINAIIYGDQEFFGYYDSDNFVIEFTKHIATVHYSLVPQVRPWGLDVILIKIEKIICSIEWYVQDADECSEQEIEKLLSYGGIKEVNGDISGKIDIDSTKPLKGKDWEINNDCEFSKNGHFSIMEIEINLRSAEIAMG